MQTFKSRTMQPRIYVYKITFLEVPHYYYGVHKEKVFNEEYFGSPYTHKNYWEKYTPQKEILELFDFNDNGWIQAQKVEKDYIKPVYNTDPHCLNENCGGLFSLEHQRINGKKGSEKAKEMGVGIFSLSQEQRIENSRKSGKINGKKNYENKIGIFSLTKEQKIEISRRAGKKTYELKIGVHSLTKEQKIEIGKKGSKNTNQQRWMCLETGYITTSGPLSLYQKKRGIDISKRIKL